jgi:hypothetical protein
MQEMELFYTQLHINNIALNINKRHIHILIHSISHDNQQCQKNTRSETGLSA